MGKKGKNEKKSDLKQNDDEESRKKASEDSRLKEIIENTIEEENSKINSLKIQSRWRDIMKLGRFVTKVAKSEELKKELQTLQQIQSRKIDRKDELIKKLKICVDESAEQYSNALQHHLMNIDMLTDLQKTRLDTINGYFQSDIALLETEFGTEKIKLQAQHAKDRSGILGIIARADQEFEDTESDAKHEFSSVKDDVKNKHAEEKHTLRIQLESTAEELWKQFEIALTNYNSATEERKKQFELLKDKDQKNAVDAEHQMKKLRKLQENIAHLKMKMTTNTKEFDAKNHGVKAEKEKIQARFQALKKRMNLFRDEERARLTELTLLSSSTIKKLQVKAEKAETIIKLAEMNQKLETEEEKILPFYEESVAQIDNLHLNFELPKEFEGMQQFAKRFNKVYLDKLTLEKKEEKLSKENSKLKSLLKQYLDGISLSETVLAQLNPLFVVNGKTNVSLQREKASLA